MSSGALNSATLALAKDHASDGVRFVTIAPGIFRTPLVISHMNELVINSRIFRHSFLILL